MNFASTEKCFSCRSGEAFLLFINQLNKAFEVCYTKDCALEKLKPYAQNPLVIIFRQLNKVSNVKN